MNKYKEVERAYKEILEVVDRYKDIIIFNQSDLESSSKKHLFGIKLVEEYGLEINPESVQNLDYIRVDDYRFIGWYGEKYRRTVSWSGDGNQPEDELMFSLCFPTGGYIFGEDYRERLFKEFFNELKSYNPKYTDTENKQLYFPIESCADIFNEFPNILKRYKELYNADEKQRRIDKLKEQISKLES